MATSVQLAVPNPLSLEGDLKLNFAIFRTAWDSYLEASEYDQKPDRQKIALLKTVLGHEVLVKMHTMTFTADDTNTHRTLLDALEQKLLPKINTTFERYVLRTAVQNVGESIDDYLQRLRVLAKTCSYGTFEEEILKDQLVLGVRSSDMRKKLLQRDDLKLTGAINICMSAEMADKQVKEIDHDPVVVNKFLRNKHRDKFSRKAGPSSARSSTLPSCKFCAGKHPFEQNRCPAIGHMCKRCRRYGHFENCCYGREKEKQTKAVNEIEEKDTENEYNICITANLEPGKVEPMITSQGT